MPYIIYGLSADDWAAVQERTGKLMFSNRPEQGRRIRTFQRLNSRQPDDATLEEFMDFCENARGICDPFSRIPLRIGPQQIFESIPPGGGRSSANAAVHPGLRDLAYEILEDIQEAADAALGNGYFTGIDDGIEPVSDDHVRLVIWALQRELERERRYKRDVDYSEHLPAVQLATFPWPIQRALAEKRRYRYQQWGIGRKQWEENAWSLWDVPLDPDYRSRREARGLAEGNDARRPGTGRD